MIPFLNGRRCCRGPAGLTAAADLAKQAMRLRFLSLSELGGVLIYGIPEFRLPKALLKKEIEKLKVWGLLPTNVVIGKPSLLTSEGYQAVFIGSGAGLPKFMNSRRNLNGLIQLPNTSPVLI